MEIHVWGRPAFAARGDSDGVPIVLVHGAGMDHSVWAAQVTALPAIAPDLPGHGRSAGEPLSTVEEMGRWLLAFLDAADIGRAVLGGHSMGALVALAAASQAPDRTAGLALLGAADRMPVNAALLDLARADAPAANRMVAKWAFARGFDPSAVLIAMDAAAPGALHADLAACDAWAGPPSLPSGLPALVVIGGADRMAPPEGGRRLAAALGATTLELDGVGHMLPVEAPAAIIDGVAKQFRTGGIRR